MISIFEISQAEKRFHNWNTTSRGPNTTGLIIGYSIIRHEFILGRFLDSYLYVQFGILTLRDSKNNSFPINYWTEVGA
jgi:hypothetical protein